MILGCLTTYWDIIQSQEAAQAFPLLVDAARQVGAIQIQTRGTWAGNIANGSPIGDTPPPLIVSDLNQTSYDLPPLSESTMYYWQIVAKDKDGQTAGDVWSFTTTSMGYGGYGGYYGGMGTTTTRATTYTDGTLILDAYEPGDKQLIWRGTGTVTLKSKPEKIDKQIDNIFNKMGKKWDKILAGKGK